MIIDFHAHVFPDAMAKKTIETIAYNAGTKPEAYGSLAELRSAMIESGVSVSVNLPVVTKLSQFNTVNKYALEISKEYEDGTRIISFGGIHPCSDNYKEELKTIKSMGFKGIKLHPDYQEIEFSDPRVMRLIDYAANLDLLVLTHAGLDFVYPDSTKCKPLHVKKVLDEINPPNLILAHMGGLFFFEGVEEWLVGKDIYFDTAYLLGKIPRELFMRIVRAHGADKVLFASDFPWTNQKACVKYIEELPLTLEEKNKILFENGKKLLKI